MNEYSKYTNVLKKQFTGNTLKSFLCVFAGVILFFLSMITYKEYPTVQASLLIIGVIAFISSNDYSKKSSEEYKNGQN